LSTADTSLSPRAVVAVPVYNEEGHLAETLDSLLAQTEYRLRILIVDNRSTDGTPQIAERYARADGRVIIERREHHVGIVESWRGAFRRARELYPSAGYFAWFGGHDTLSPRWLEVLATELDAHPSLVGCFGTGVAVSATGESSRDMKTPGDTFGLRRARDRVRVRLPGTVIQGLFRADRLERTGVSRRVVFPDRLLLAELAGQGEIRHVPERLWWRRMNPPMTHAELEARQRAVIFPRGAPWWAHLPWLAAHVGVLVWSLAVRGAARPGVGRAEGVVVAGAYAYDELARRYRVARRRRASLRRAVKAYRRLARNPRKRLRRLGRPLRRARRRLRRRLRRIGKA